MCKEDKKMIIANLVAYIIVLLGAVNWGLIGIFGWNLVGAIMGGALATGAMIIYILVFLAGIWLIISPFLTHGRLLLSPKE
jgi:uncharacterized membrane protein YuzA (DUF378 family)